VILRTGASSLASSRKFRKIALTHLVWLWGNCCWANCVRTPIGRRLRPSVHQYPATIQKNVLAKSMTNRPWMFLFIILWYGFCKLYAAFSIHPDGRIMVEGVLTWCVHCFFWFSPYFSP
jgi:hypothetical protein